MEATRQFIPPGLDTMVPGPGLAAVLDGLDTSRLTGEDLVTVTRAWGRQLNHTHAGWLDTTLELTLCAPGPDAHPARYESVPPFGSDEVRAVQVCSAEVAARRVREGEALRFTFPAVGAAHRAGDLDDVRVGVCLRETEGIDYDVAAAALGQVLPEAPELTPGELARRLAELIGALDPEAATERYSAGVARRRLRGLRNPDGTMDLCGINLPAEQVADAVDRIDAIIVALKTGGHPGLLRTLRADVHLGLLDGRWETWTDAEIVARLLATAHTYPDTVDEHGNADPAGPGDATGARGEPENDGEPGNGDREPGEPGEGEPGEGEPGEGEPGEGEPAEGEPADGEPADGVPGEDGEPGDGDGEGGLGAGPDDPRGPRGPDGCGSTGGADAEPDPSGDPACGETGPRGDSITEPDPPDPGPGPGPGPSGPLHPAAAGALRARRRPRIELRLRLSSLLGRDRHPAELVTTGVGAQPLPAALATLLAGHYRRGRWRLVLTDDHGHLIAASTTRARPTDPPPLTKQTGAGCGPRPAGDIGPRPARDIGPWLVGHPGHAVVEIQVPRALLADLDIAAHPGAAALITAAHQLAARGPTPPTSTKPPRRQPHAALEDTNPARDRTCGFPGCTEPALGADIDHTHDHAHGGNTIAGNLAALCRADHHAKHRGRWAVRQPHPGTFLWTGPTGHTYRRVRRALLTDLPHPADPPRRSPSQRLCLAYEPRWQPGDHAMTINDGPPVIDPPPPPRPPPPQRGPGIRTLLRRAAHGLTTPDNPDDPPPF